MTKSEVDLFSNAKVGDVVECDGHKYQVYKSGDGGCAVCAFNEKECSIRMCCKFYRTSGDYVYFKKVVGMKHWIDQAIEELQDVGAPKPESCQTVSGKITGNISEMDEFVKSSLEIGTLVSEKNKAYGDSFGRGGEFLKILYPNGIAPEQYTDVLCQIRIFDKQMRIANNKNAFGESPYGDIAGYALLGLNNKPRNKRG